MLDFIQLFEDPDLGESRNAHPADAVPAYLATGNQEGLQLNMKSLEDWFKGYQTKRNQTLPFKPAPCLPLAKPSLLKTCKISC